MHLELNTVKYLFFKKDTQDKVDALIKIINNHAEMFEEMCEILEQLDEHGAFTVILNALVQDIRRQVLFGNP